MPPRTLTGVNPGDVRTSRVRLAGIALAALVSIVPAAAFAQQDDEDDEDSTTTTSTTVVPGTTTTLVPLVTSPPPTEAPATTIAAPTAGRIWPVAVPTGCAAPPLPDLVFLGTMQAADYQTARFRVDQVRAGSIERFAFGDLVDVRFGIDTKYLEPGQQYLVGASLDPATAVLSSKVTDEAELFGGDDVIGAAETDADCPLLDDPVRTLRADGTAVDSGLLSPLSGAKDDLLQSLLVPGAVALAIVLGLVIIRWIITGLGYGLGSLSSTVRQRREVRAVYRTNLRSRQPR